ncbi:MAG: hypothetical protein IPJ39_19710 [Saprospiraceae bacterium]|nr:hypothetical protein [Saprospiraceae bacterium]
MGNDIPTRTGDLVNCEGVYTYTWEVTDQCNRTITLHKILPFFRHQRATFINPPADVSVSCLNAPDPNALPPLDYTSGVTDPQAFARLWAMTSQRELEICNIVGVYTYAWEVTDQCNRTITHTEYNHSSTSTGHIYQSASDITVLCTDAQDLSVAADFIV